MLRSETISQSWSGASALISQQPLDEQKTADQEDKKDGGKQVEVTFYKVTDRGAEFINKSRYQEKTR